MLFSELTRRCAAIASGSLWGITAVVTAVAAMIYDKSQLCRCGRSNLYRVLQEFSNCCISGYDCQINCPQSRAESLQVSNGVFSAFALCACGFRRVLTNSRKSQSFSIRKSAACTISCISISQALIVLFLVFGTQSVVGNRKFNV